MINKKHKKELKRYRYRTKIIQKLKIKNFEKIIIMFKIFVIKIDKVARIENIIILK